jgi:20S proteasome alpha/beta subunit
MTIIVGLKCIDGVVIASDSQQEFGRGVAVKRLNMGKVYILDRRLAIAGAGALAHIEKAVDSIRTGIDAARTRKGGLDLDESECVDAIEKSITAVNREYNIQRARFLGDPKEKDFFSPILICGGIAGAKGKEKVCVFIVHSAGLVEKLTDYGTAGSGAAYAEFLLKNFYYGDMTVKEAIPLAIYTIEEVKSIDPNCGGETRVAVAKPKQGIKELSREEVLNLSNKIVSQISVLWTRFIPMMLRGEINEKRLKKALEK